PPDPKSDALSIAPLRQTEAKTTSTRFELARAEPSRFLIYLLNHSDTTSFCHRQRVRVVKEVDSKSTGLCPREFKSCRCRPLFMQKKKKKSLTPEGIEPPIFGSGIRRVTIAPWSQSTDL